MVPLPRAVVATLAVLLVAGCASGTDAADPPARQVEWTAMAESPLGSRGGVLSAWTGEELLILGGSTSRPCPPGADCVGPSAEQLLTDGAAYDPDTDMWRALADAPQTLQWAVATWTGAELVVVVPALDTEVVQPAATLAYDVAADTWRALPAGPAEFYGRGVWNGSELFFPTSETTYGADWALDPATGRWRELSADPFGGSFDRSFTWVDDRFLVTGLPMSDVGGSDGAPYQLAQYRPDTDTWARLPPTAVGFWDPTWFLADGRLVNVRQDAYTAGSDLSLSPGGQLDLATGVWSPVPQTELSGQKLYLGCQLPAVGPAGDWIGGGGPILVSLDPPTTTFVDNCAGLTEPQLAVWTGSEILMWGGPDAGYETYLSQGYRWTPPPPS